MAKDHLNRVEDIGRIYRVISAFGLPVDPNLYDAKGGIVVPKLPLLCAEGQFYSSPQEMMKTDDGRWGEKWQDFCQSIKYLTNQYTSFRIVVDGIWDHAVKVFSIGSDLANRVPDLRVILPPSVGINPIFTPGKEWSTPQGDKFRHNSWQPQFLDVSSGTVVPFGLILSNGNKTYDHRLQYTVGK